MEHAGSKLEEASLKKAMKSSGLGTPATRASILETLIRRGYLRRVSKVLEPTETGEILISAMTSEDLRSPTLTAQWDYQLQQIADGVLNPNHFQSQVRSWVSQLSSSDVI